MKRASFVAAILLVLALSDGARARDVVDQKPSKSNGKRDKVYDSSSVFGFYTSLPCVYGGVCNEATEGGCGTSEFCCPSSCAQCSRDPIADTCECQECYVTPAPLSTSRQYSDTPSWWPRWTTPNPSSFRTTNGWTPGWTPEWTPEWAPQWTPSRDGSWSETRWGSSRPHGDTQTTYDLACSVSGAWHYSIDDGFSTNNVDLHIGAMFSDYGASRARFNLTQSFFSQNSVNCTLELGGELQFSATSIDNMRGHITLDSCFKAANQYNCFCPEYGFVPWFEADNSDCSLLRFDTTLFSFGRGGLPRASYVQAESLALERYVRKHQSLLHNDRDFLGIGLFSAALLVVFFLVLVILCCAVHCKRGANDKAHPEHGDMVTGHLVAAILFALYCSVGFFVNYSLSVECSAIDPTGAEPSSLQRVLLDFGLSSQAFSVPSRWNIASLVFFVLAVIRAGTIPLQMVAITSDCFHSRSAKIFKVFFWSLIVLAQSVFLVTHLLGLVATIIAVVSLGLLPYLVIVSVFLAALSAVWFWVGTLVAIRTSRIVRGMRHPALHDNDEHLRALLDDQLKNNRYLVGQPGANYGAINGDGGPVLVHGAYGAPDIGGVAQLDIPAAAARAPPHVHRALPPFIPPQAARVAADRQEHVENRNNNNNNNDHNNFNNAHQRGDAHARHVANDFVYRPPPPINPNFDPNANFIGPDVQFALVDNPNNADDSGKNDHRAARGPPVK